LWGTLRISPFAGKLTRRSQSPIISGLHFHQFNPPGRQEKAMSKRWRWQYGRLARSLAIGAALAIFGAASAYAAEPIKIGHVAALSGASAQSGEAITRGLSLAIDEINAKGGLLGGRMLELVQRDDESNPPKGLIAARELASRSSSASASGRDRRGRVTFTRATVAEVARFGDAPIEGDELAVAAALAALGLDWSGTRMDGFRQRARALVREERRSIRVLAAALLERRTMTGDEIGVLLSAVTAPRALWVVA
jgi:Periplasmic binding protein